MIKKLKIFTFLAIIILNSISFAQTVQEKGSTTLTLGKGRRVCVKETGRPYDKKIHVQAISKAKLAAWNSYVSKFSPDKSKEILFYCNGTRCLRSSDSINKAKVWGYSNLIWFRGGWKEWTEKRLPIITD